MAGPSTQRKRWRVVIVVAALLIAVNLLILAGRSTEQGGDREPLPDAIESVDPIQDGIASSDSSIRVDLRDDLTGVLIVDGIEIPDDQVTGTPELGQLEFRPGEDAELARLEPGQHRVTVEYWPNTKTRAESESFSWQFRAAG